MNEHPPDVYVHPMAICDTADVGTGTRIWAFSHVQAGAVVGRDCNLGEGVFVEESARLGDRVVVKNGVSVWALVTLEDDVFAGPNVAFTNDLKPRSGEYRTPRDKWLATVVREGACLGANATIVCGVVIGRHALVGAGSLVSRDVADHAVVVGNPARVVGWICVCGEQLGGAGACPVCGRVYERSDTGLVESVQ